MPEDPRPAADEPRPDAVAPDPAAPGAAVPDEAELARVAVPATVRRAPRYRAFMVTGGLVGMVVGLVVAAVGGVDSGLVGSDGGMLPFLGGVNGVRWVTALGMGLAGVFLGGLVALLADRRSTRRRRPAPRD